MKKTLKLLFLVIFGTVTFAGASQLGEFVKISEQEINGFTPFILNEVTEKTETMDYKFDIKTIKYIEEIPEVPESIDEKTGETILAVPAVPAHYEYVTVNYIKKIGDKEWNYCRETKTLEECKKEIAKIIADAKTFQINKEKERFSQLQGDLTRVDCFNEEIK